MMKVVVADRIHEDGLRILRSAGVEVVEAWDVPKEELPRLLGDADALIVRSATKVTEELMEAAPRLKVIGRAGVGLDNVDLEAARRRGIKVVNTPEASSVSVAELAILHILNALRRIVDGTVSLRDGRWEKKRLMGRELMGKTVGIVGLGRIGREVARRLLAFGTRILAYDKYVRESPLEGVELVDLETLLRESDIITIHVPLTPETHHMISDRELEIVKPGAVIVNTARGGVLDEAAALRALRDGRISVLSLDVFEEEPPRNRELLEHPNFYGTPHLGAQTVEAQRRAGVGIAERVLEELGWSR